MLLQVDKPATFSVNFNGAQGTLKGYVDTPSGARDEVLIQEVDNDLNSCRFLPHENGVYYVHLKFNDAHIPGSPFAMLIGKLGADPALVVAQGDGLQSGISGACQLNAVLLLSRRRTWGLEGKDEDHRRQTDFPRRQNTETL